MVAGGLLAVSVAAMAGLHLVQPQLDPWREPVSFYLHGRGGGLLPLALASFGAAALVLSRRAVWCQAPGGRWALAGFGAGMVVTAVIGSDEWFPWEEAPSMGGLTHATVAVVAPLLLLVPMARSAELAAGRWNRAVGWLAAYLVGLIASGGSLVVGLVQDRAPPWIGWGERVLALAAVGWMAEQAWTRPRGSGAAGRD